MHHWFSNVNIRADRSNQSTSTTHFRDQALWGPKFASWCGQKKGCPISNAWPRACQKSSHPDLSGTGLTGLSLICLIPLLSDSSSGEQVD